MSDRKFEFEHIPLNLQQGLVRLKTDENILNQVVAIYHKAQGGILFIDCAWVSETDAIKALCPEDLEVGKVSDGFRIDTWDERVEKHLIARHKESESV